MKPPALTTFEKGSKSPKESMTPEAIRSAFGPIKVNKQVIPQ